MPCNQLRILQREREEEEDRKRKKKMEEARAAIRQQAKKFGWKLNEVRSNVFVASKSYSDDKITFTVLEGGIIKTVTDEISMANHGNAEDFLRSVAQVMGGVWKIFHRHGRGAYHTHDHEHA